MLSQTQQRELLDAMGIDVFVLRTGNDAWDFADNEAQVDVVVVCGEDPASNPQARILRACLPRALGIGSDRIKWLRSRAGGIVPELPPAYACLLMGSALADAFQARNSSKMYDTMLIAMADTPAESLHTPLARKGLWEILKPLRRHLATASV